MHPLIAALISWSPQLNELSALPAHLPLFPALSPLTPLFSIPLSLGKFRKFLGACAKIITDKALNIKLHTYLFWHVRQEGGRVEYEEGGKGRAACPDCSSTTRHSSGRARPHFLPTRRTLQCPQHQLALLLLLSILPPLLLLLLLVSLSVSGQGYSNTFCAGQHKLSALNCRRRRRHLGVYFVGILRLQVATFTAGKRGGGVSLGRTLVVALWQARQCLDA